MFSKNYINPKLTCQQHKKLFKYYCNKCKLHLCENCLNELSCSIYSITGNDTLQNDNDLTWK